MSSIKLRKDRPIGHYVGPGQSLEKAIQEAQAQLFRFIVTPLEHPRRPDHRPLCDLDLKGGDWWRFVAIEISTQDFDEDPLDRNAKCEQQISYSLHLGIGTIVMDLPTTRPAIRQFARFINAMLPLTTHNQTQFWIVLPLNSRLSTDLVDDAGDQLMANGHFNAAIGLNQNNVIDGFRDSWEQWQYFCSMIDVDRRVQLILDIDGDMPDMATSDRWCGEYVRGIILHTQDFSFNKQKYPVLLPHQQRFIMQLMSASARKLHVIVKGAPAFNPDHKELSLRHYVLYIEQHLRAGSYDQDKANDAYWQSVGYEDMLQLPLQPLKDHLESITYEVFERDPIKYESYKRAMQKALEDVLERNAMSKHLPVMMIVGAGRGPLVDQAISAINAVRPDFVYLYVIEKNPNAMYTLKERYNSDWKYQLRVKVTLVESDMRLYTCPEKVDIVVSELLGSFGDNELSPECLDGVWRSCTRNTISIPQWYTSYLQPIMSVRLHHEVLFQRTGCPEKPHEYVFENNYVVYIKNAFRVDVPKPVFTFDHRNLSLEPNNRDNRRYCQLSFKSDIDYVCHGFAGYFEAGLYKDIVLSTVPNHFSTGMFSWFPIFFPISDPIPVRRDQQLTMNMYRFCDPMKVWYEWNVIEPKAIPYHNPKGRSLAIGL